MGVTAANLAARRGTFSLSVASFAADASGTAVLGPNGAGKTTLLLALQALIPTQGRVAAPARTAAVFARPATLRGTALTNVSIVLQAVRGFGATAAAARARTVLEAVGLAEAVDIETRALSTGQRQRLALARAVATEPDALFLDEPFANIDADGLRALRDLVRGYVAESGCTLVLATSSLADARALCASALVLQAGRVASSCRTSSLNESPEPYVRALLEESRLALDEP
jgi:tungstate transport system ATP-binding protein